MATIACGEEDPKGASCESFEVTGGATLDENPTAAEVGLRFSDLTSGRLRLARSMTGRVRMLGTGDYGCSDRTSQSMRASGYS